ncbi:MAG: bZIP transcription factor [Candidatus Omnitrophica bacterium]|nr:bZIP transcription factor [Candidatus Omnitrophota bacterium]
MSNTKIFHGSGAGTGILILCFSLLLPGVLGVSQSSADDGERSERMEKLEREVQELKTIVNQLVEENRSLKASQAQMQALSPVPAPTLPEKHGAAPVLNIRGFGNIQYDFSSVNRNDSTESDTNNFALGDFDLFITSRVGDKISFLGETLFEFPSSGGTSVDVERLLLKYEWADCLNISIGRGHTASSYWNQYYHHGKWLYTTTDRPVTQRWEDEGGILPAHFVGIEAGGFVDVPGGTLSYISELGNGRGTVTDDVQMVADKNDSKMENIFLTYEPRAIEGLGVGGSFLHDTIPAKPGTANRGNEIDEDIYGAHLTYTLIPYEFIAETNIIDHYNHATSLRNVTTGGYVQLAYVINKYKPYFRYDWLWLDDADPFFPGVQDEVGYTTGLRYELSAYNALKLEYRYVNKDDEYKNEFTVQSSFAF